MSRLFKYKRLIKDQKGQSLVEFAITAPIMVAILLFSIYFYESWQIRFKFQEIARYGAWEYTAYNLHEYGASTVENWTAIGFAHLTIAADIALRYRNLDSADSMLNPSTANQYIATQFNMIPMPVQELRKVPYIPETPLNSWGSWVNIGIGLVDAAIMYFAGKALSDNLSGGDLIGQAVAGVMVAKYFVQSSLLTDFNVSSGMVVFKINGNILHSSWIPFNVFFWTRWSTPTITSPDGEVLSDNKAIQIREVHPLIVDAWALQVGDDLPKEKDNSGSTNKYPDEVMGSQFSKQVKKIAFAGLTDISGLKEILDGIASILEVLMGEGSVLDPVVVSRAYGRNDQNDNGKIQISVDGGRKEFDTAPQREKKGEDSEYKKTLENRGNNFMGCKTAQSPVCGATTWTFSF